ncbi:MAG: hypothetical protein ACRYFK_09295 [Janthinobacterium lividum]
MNRELSIDASQVSLGDDSTLTLSSEPRKKPLATELGSQGLIKLTVDHLADNRPAEAHYFPYFVDGLGLQLRSEVLIAAPKPGGPAPKNTPPPKLFYSKLEPIIKAQQLGSGQSVDLTWSVRVWDQPGTFVIGGEISSGDPATLERDIATDVALPSPLDFGPVKLRVQLQDTAAPVHVTMSEADRTESNDQTLWGLIRRRTISFSQYQGFINRVLCTPDGNEGQKARAYAQSRPLAFSRSASYSMLKYATEYFLMQEAGLALGDALDTGVGSGNLNSAGPGSLPADLDEQRRLGGAPFGLSALRDTYLEQLENEEGKVLPYFKIIREKLAEVPLKNPQDLIGGDDLCYGILKSKLQSPPLMELIWSYWHEEGGLVQTLNAISLRFQNVRRPGYGPDLLAGLNLDPLRPMANLMWGYIEDERNRLTLNRRNLEYQYEYGIGLIGRGVQPIAVAENRTFSLRGFHSLLRACTEFYQQANFTTVIPDGFPILNCLREVHMTLAEGAHNQYGDLPWTARAEMLTQQWLLARPEVREFLGAA